MAFTFGLLHGLGFAGALSEVGLPEGHIPLALLFFNIGVEIGQLLFIAAVLWLLCADAGAFAMTWPRWAGLAAPYAIGSLAMFWVISASPHFDLPRAALRSEKRMRHDADDNVIATAGCSPA